MKCTVRVLMSLGILCFIMQERLLAQEADTSSMHRLRQDMDSIASDATEGRLSGSPGYRKAAQYAAAKFQTAGLRPGYIDDEGRQSYLQPVPLIRDDYSSSSITIQKNGTKKAYLYSDGGFDILNAGAAQGHVQGVSPAFVGYGIHEPGKGWDDFGGIDVKGKWVILQNGIPPDSADPAFPRSLRTAYGNEKTRDSLKLDALISHQAVGVIVLPDEYTMASWERSWERSMVDYHRRNDVHYAGADARGKVSSGPPLPIIRVSPDLARTLFAGQQFDPTHNSGKNHSYVFDNTTLAVRIDLKKNSLNSFNVIAVVPGIDPVLSKEYVTVGAHLDHLGKVGDHVYCGANDDASGCVIILEAARAIVLNPLKRSVLFALYTSEEESLIGSRHFLENPPVPIKQITLNINLEQIGSKHRDYEGIWAIGDPQFKESFYRTASTFPKTAIKFDSIERLRRLLDGQVDLWNYHTRGIPAVMLSSGGFPEHHTLQDRIDLIDFEHLSVAAKMLSSFIGTLGNR